MRKDFLGKYLLFRRDDSNLYQDNGGKFTEDIDFYDRKLGGFNDRLQWVGRGEEEV